MLLTPSSLIPCRMACAKSVGVIVTIVMVKSRRFVSDKLFDEVVPDTILQDRHNDDVIPEG